MKAQKIGSAHWEGSLKAGTGSLSTETGALKQHPYGFTARFEEGRGTNPEELIAAAHAGCFTMALSKALGDAGYTARALDTQATVTLESAGDGFAITTSHLSLKANVPEIEPEQFKQLADTVKSECPVSKVLNVKISLEVELVER